MRGPSPRVARRGARSQLAATGRGGFPPDRRDGSGGVPSRPPRPDGRGSLPTTATGREGSGNPFFHLPAPRPSSATPAPRAIDDSVFQGGQFARVVGFQQRLHVDERHEHVPRLGVLQEQVSGRGGWDCGAAGAPGPNSQWPGQTNRLCGAGEAARTQPDPPLSLRHLQPHRANALQLDVGRVAGRGAVEIRPLRHVQQYYHTHADITTCEEGGRGPVVAGACSQRRECPSRTRSGLARPKQQCLAVFDKCNARQAKRTCP